MCSIEQGIERSSKPLEPAARDLRASIGSHTMARRGGPVGSLCQAVRITRIFKYTMTAWRDLSFPLLADLGQMWFGLAMAQPLRPHSRSAPARALLATSTAVEG